jgi:hypothetical protein
MWSRPEVKRAKTVKTSRTLPVAESSTLESELRGVLWSTGTIADAENEPVRMGASEPESRGMSLSLSSLPTNADTVPPPTNPTMEMSPTIANTETMCPPNASLPPFVYGPLEYSDGNVQGDIVPSHDFASRVQDITFGIPDAESPKKAAPEAANTINNFVVDTADMPALWDDSL